MTKNLNQSRKQRQIVHGSISSFLTSPFYIAVLAFRKVAKQQHALKHRSSVDRRKPSFYRLYLCCWYWCCSTLKRLNTVVLFWYTLKNRASVEFSFKQTKFLFSFSVTIQNTGHTLNALSSSNHLQCTILLFKCMFRFTNY